MREEAGSFMTGRQPGRLLANMLVVVEVILG